jgi:putative membrane protein
MTQQQLYDPGLQPERTALAWRRTTLAITVGALIALRLLPAVLGHWAVIAGFSGLALAGLLWALAQRRAQHIQRALLDNDRPLPGGGLLLLLTTLTTTGATLGLVYVTLK